LEGFKGTISRSNFDISFITRQALGLTGDGHLIDIDIESDFKDFNDSIISENLYKASELNAKYI